MFTKRQVEKFIDNFREVLFEEMENAKTRLDKAETEGNKDQIFRESCELMQREFVYQTFGKHAKQKLGIKIFEE